MRKLVCGITCLVMLANQSVGAAVIQGATLIRPTQNAIDSPLWIGYEVDGQVGGGFAAYTVKPFGVDVLGVGALPVLVPDEPAVLFVDTGPGVNGVFFVLTAVFLQFRTVDPLTPDLANFSVQVHLGSLDDENKFIQGATSAQFSTSALDIQIGTPEGEIPTPAVEKYSSDLKTWTHERNLPTDSQSLLARPFEINNVPEDDFAIQFTLLTPEPSTGLLIAGFVGMVGLRRRSN